MDNYYNYLNVKEDCKPKDIISAYQNKINIYKLKTNLNEEDIKHIKNLKKGIYILLDDDLRNKYNILLQNNNNINNNNNNNNDNDNDNDNDIMPMNNEYETDFDVLFPTKEINFTNNNFIKKNEENIINDRIFQNRFIESSPNTEIINKNDNLNINRYNTCKSGPNIDNNNNLNCKKKNNNNSFDILDLKNLSH
jgi:DnaJ-class molecular chaperone